MTDTRTFRVVDEDGDYYEITGDPMDALNALTARVAELERELLALRGTELNPSPTILDAQSYGELRDEIAATMGDEWDLDEAEISILIKYVRWLAAGQPRDEDGYPIRRKAPEGLGDASGASRCRNLEATTALPRPDEQPQDERDGDVRAVAALLAAQAAGASMAECKHAFGDLRARFADRIAELDAREAKGGE